MFKDFAAATRIVLDSPHGVLHFMSCWPKVFRKPIFALPAIGFLCVALIALAAATSALAIQPEKPRLAVLVMFDQLRGDFLSRWADLYAADGFRRLQTEGAWYRNCHYPYSNTVTAAGHASILTGCSPAEHGILGNEWYDRTSGSMISCVHTGVYERVPPLMPTDPIVQTKKTAEVYNVSPKLLLVDGLGDALIQATSGKGRIVALSHKDRSAILPVGRTHEAACYWFDQENGQFITSSYYRDRIHSWVAEFNRSRKVDSWFSTPWTHLRSDLDYDRYSGPDDVSAEGKGFAQGRTFPHPMNGGTDRPGKPYYQALYSSPFGNEMLLELAERAIVSEKLGTRDIPDLLCLSFSSNDAIGHCWGPDSHEVLDVTLRSDLIIRKLLACLDANVGRGKYVLLLTADHGVCPLPELSRAKGIEAARVPAEILGSWAEAHLDEVFGKSDSKSRWIEAKQDLSIYLNQRLLKGRNIPSSRVEAVLTQWLHKQSGVQAVYTRTELMNGLRPDDALGKQVAISFHPQRSGDLFVVLKPYHLLVSPLALSTTHGSPHSYDTHVPCLVIGPGLRSGVHDEAITPQAACAILAHALGIKPPAACRAGLPSGLFAEVSER